MLKRILYSLLLLAAVSLQPCLAQTPNTQGKAFWVSFMKNGYRRDNTDSKLTLIASAKRECGLEWYNPKTGNAENYTVPGHGVFFLEIDANEVYNNQMAGKAGKGIFVSSTDVISLYIANEANNSFDAANVLPVTALGCSYMIQTNKSIGEAGSTYTGLNRASFLVVATQDGTRVSITPSCQTYDGHEANKAYEIELSRGECYHVINKNPGGEGNSDGDFTGTWVESLNPNKPIAVFNGNCLTRVMETQQGTSGFEHVFEQAMPVNNWGRHFVVTSTYPCLGLQPDWVKFTALQDETTVQMSYGTRRTYQLNSGESDAFWMDLTDQPCAYLESDKPIAVYLYNHSHKSNNSGSNYGDPSMVWISPVEQNIEEVTFSTFQTGYDSGDTIVRHFVNIVCRSDARALLLDGVDIVDALNPVSVAPEYAYVRVDTLRHGAHNIVCLDGFTAHVYGVGKNKGYAYTVGSSARDLEKKLYVDGISSEDLPNGYSVCQNQATVGFRLLYNGTFHHVGWDFGDGTTDEGDEVIHEFGTFGDYEVLATLYSEVGDTLQPAGQLSVTIHVKVFEMAYESKIVCGPTYLWHDSVLCDHSGSYSLTVPQEDGCDSIYYLNLQFDNPPAHPEREVESCAAYNWNGVMCEDSGPYYQTFFTDVAGCPYDSILYFTLLPTGDTDPQVVAACDYYEWMDRVYTYSDYGPWVTDTVVITGGDGCQTRFILDLTLRESPAFTSIVGPGNVAVATNYWPGAYTYHLDDSTALDLDRLRWELLDNPEGSGQWDFKPNGASCTIIAYSMGIRTLRVSSGDGECDKTIEFEIRCSGYGIDENALTFLEVYPNPAKEEVTVKGCAMNEIQVMNLLGQKVKTIPVNGASEAIVKVEDLPSAPYLLQICTPKGNKTKLVSVIK